MVNCYSKDMRLAALKYIEEGKSVAMICDFFKITQKTLYNWRKCDIESPINDRKTYSKSNKLHDLLRDEIDKNPDATLAEMGAIFGKSPSNIDYHLRKMNITRKKNHALSRAR